MAIVLDAMGSDAFPNPEIEAAIIASEELQEEIILVGKESLIAPKLASYKNRGRVRLVDAPDVLEMGEHPVEAARKKAKNSMAVGIELVKTGEAGAFVSAGNTGGIMFNALRILGRIPGVDRPALLGMFPTQTGFSALIDIGANVDCRPDFLVQFAIMGSEYFEKVRGVPNPKVGLLSNGEEDGKGNELVKAANILLKNAPVNFVGNIEGKELFAGAVDVAVMDGFVGNVILKSSEAVAKMLVTTLKTSLMGSLRNKIGALIAKPAFNEMKAKLDPEAIGAAPLIGVNGLVFVGHGRSSAKALVSGLKTAQDAIKANFVNSLSTAIQSSLSNQGTEEKS